MKREHIEPLSQQAVAVPEAVRPLTGRATFSTVVKERHYQDREIIDLALAHAPTEKTESVYNRATHMTRRRALLQEWADFLLASAMESAELVDGCRRV